MVWFHSFLAVSSAILFIFFVDPTSGTLEVTRPYPGHVVAIQGEQINVTCVIINPENDTTHDNFTEILFYKITSRFGDKELITVNNAKYSYDFKMDYFQGVPRWNGTLIIENITRAEVGQYECQVNGTYAARYGFGISYIEKKDLPAINYTEDKEVDFDDPVTLSCSLVEQGNKFSVKLVSIAWFSGNEKLQEIKHPEDETLKNINLTMNKPEDAGTYKCQLTSILRLQRKYTTTGTIRVKVRPNFTKKYYEELEGVDNEIIRKKGESATMKCEARGNPIKIIWQKQERSESTRITLNQTVNSSKYDFSSETKYEGFKLEIPKTDYENRGEYYCCFDSSSNSSVEDLKCQEFTLRVKDPLGWLWPLIGIICEAILIILILLIAAKFKAKKEETYKSDTNTELSYTITNDGSKGHIRLRNTGATAN